jgi:hypothetical protein
MPWINDFTLTRSYLINAQFTPTMKKILTLTAATILVLCFGPTMAQAQTPATGSGTGVSPTRSGSPVRVSPSQSAQIADEETAADPALSAQKEAARAKMNSQGHEGPGVILIDEKDLAGYSPERLAQIKAHPETYKIVKSGTATNGATLKQD